MTERDLNKRLVTTLRRAGLDPQRVENSVNPGCPDIEFIGGWIESKFLRRWPKKSGVVVRLNHFTRQQRAFHARRSAAGGKSLVILECAGELLVFDGLEAAQQLGYLHRAGLYDIALLALHRYDEIQFLKWLTSWLANKK